MAFHPLGTEALTKNLLNRQEQERTSAFGTLAKGHRLPEEGLVLGIWTIIDISGMFQ